MLEWRSISCGDVRSEVEAKGLEREKDRFDGGGGYGEKAWCEKAFLAAVQ